MFKFARKAVQLVLRTIIITILIVSLGLAALVGWAWRHSAEVYQDRVEIISAGERVEVVSDREGLRFQVFQRWPWQGSGQFRATTLYSPGELDAFAFHTAAERTLVLLDGLTEVRSGRWQTFLQEERIDGPYDAAEAGNPPVRLSYADPTAVESTLDNGWRWSMALPFFEIRRVPHSLVLIVALIPAAICFSLIALLIGWRIRNWKSGSQPAYKTGSSTC